MAKTQSTKTRRQYSPAKKRAILDTADKEGIMAASRKYKVSTSLIYSWRSKAKAVPAKQMKQKIRKAKEAPERKESLKDLVLELMLENRELRARLDA